MCWLWGTRQDLKQEGLRVVSLFRGLGRTKSLPPQVREALSLKRKKQGSRYAAFRMFELKHTKPEELTDKQLRLRKTREINQACRENARQSLLQSFGSRV